MSNKYSVYKIFNPSENHCVPLMPQQDFMISLADPNLNAEIEVNSDFFDLKGRQSKDGSTSFMFSQKFNLKNWNFSKVFLGEILICYSNKMSNLYVYLDNSENIVTVINPKNASIKVNRGAIIEVVVYSDLDNNWKSKLITSDDAYEEVHYRKISLNYKDVVSCFPTVHRGQIQNFNQDEHHFWYQCNTEFTTGLHSAGKIILSNLSHECKILNINVLSKLSRPNKHKIFSFPSSRVAFKRNFDIIKKEVYFTKRENSDIDEDCESFVMTFE